MPRSCSNPLASPCEVTLDIRPVRQKGGRCLAAATSTALSARGGSVTPAMLAPALPLSRLGEDPFDLQEALQPLGWDTLVFEGSFDQGSRLVEAGFAPLLFIEDGGTPHAVVLAGVRRRQTPDGRCLGAADHVALLDPRVGAIEWTPTAAIQRHDDHDGCSSPSRRRHAAPRRCRLRPPSATRSDRRYRRSHRSPARRPGTPRMPSPSHS